MKKKLATLMLAGLVNHAAADTVETPTEPQKPPQHHEEPAILTTNNRKFDLAPHIEGTRKRWRAAQAGVTIEMDIP